MYGEAAKTYRASLRESGGLFRAVAVGFSRARR
jgi:hypothetical protein